MNIVFSLSVLWVVFLLSRIIVNIVETSKEDIKKNLGYKIVFGGFLFMTLSAMGILLFDALTHLKWI